MSLLPASASPDTPPARSPAAAPLPHTLHNSSSKTPAPCWLFSRSSSCLHPARPPPPPLPPRSPASRAAPASPDIVRRGTSPPRDSTQSPSLGAELRPWPARGSALPLSQTPPPPQKYKSPRSSRSVPPCRSPRLLFFPPLP